MKKKFFTSLAKLNKAALPSYSKQDLDLRKATTLQKAVIGFRVWVTKHALDD